MNNTEGLLAKDLCIRMFHLSTLFDDEQVREDKGSIMKMLGRVRVQGGGEALVKEVIGEIILQKRE